MYCKNNNLILVTDYITPDLIKVSRYKKNVK